MTIKRTHLLSALALLTVAAFVAGPVSAATTTPVHHKVVKHHVVAMHKKIVHHPVHKVTTHHVVHKKVVPHAAS
ncbi:MAG TPA: hypothetical protein VGG99_06605 [Acetobacteraceae bacterium]